MEHLDYSNWFSAMNKIAHNHQDLEKNIESLKQVEQWLKINLNMVQNNIQFMQFYASMIGANKQTDKSEDSNNSNNSNSQNSSNNNTEDKIKETNTFPSLANLNPDMLKISQDWLENMQKMQKSWKNDGK